MAVRKGCDVTVDHDDEKDLLLMMPSPKGDGEDQAAAEGNDEEDDEEEEDGSGSGDLATLALDVPEPEQAMAANAALAGQGKKPLKTKGTKGKAGIDIVIGDVMIGAEEGEAAAAEDDPDAENAEVSAYDSDEIIDPDRSDIDPLMAILGAKEKPWENEKLSLAERMMMEPGYGRNMEALGDQEDETVQRREDHTVKIGVMASAVAGAAASQMGRQDQKDSQEKDSQEKEPQKKEFGQKDKDQKRGGSGLAGVARGPQRVMEQDQEAPVKADIRMAKNMSYQPQKEILAAGSDRQKPAAGTKEQSPGGHEFDDNYMQLIDSLPHLDGDGGGLVWNPKTAMDDGLAQTMNMIYASLALRDLMDVPAYRIAGWDDKYLEHKENSADMTVPPSVLEVKEPAPNLTPERLPQMNLGPGGV